MTLTQLEYIVSVEKHGSFVLAAKECCVTQPTLSAQVKKLEEHLQVIIFDRSKQPVEMTLIGKQIIAKARNLIRDAKEIRHLVSAAKGSVEGEYHLGIIPSIAGDLLPLFLKDFKKSYPKVKLIISEFHTEDLIEKLKKDEIDSGIASTPLLEKDIFEHPLYWEPFYVLTSKKHPFFKNDKILQSELSKENVLLLSEGNCLRNQVSQICQLKDRILDNDLLKIESGNFKILIDLVSQDMGITVLPHLTTLGLREQKKNGLIKEIDGRIPTREIGLIYRRSLVKESITNAICEIILKCIPEELQKIDQKFSEVISPI